MAGAGVWPGLFEGKSSVCFARVPCVPPLSVLSSPPPLPFIACSLCNSTALVVVLNAPRAALTCSTRTESLL